MSDVLIYSEECNGVFPISHTFCKVYRSGKVVFGEDFPDNLELKSNGSLKIPKDDIEAIEKIISKNSKIFSVKKVVASYDDAGVTDCPFSTLCFSNGLLSKTVEVYNLYGLEHNDASFLSQILPDIELVIKLHKSISKILRRYEVLKRYCR